MTARIYMSIGATLVTCIGLVAAATFIWSDVGHHVNFSAFVIGLYSLLTLGICLASARYVNHENSYLFTYITLLTVLVKLVLGVAVVIGYHYLYVGEDIAYIVPFFIAYVLFTIAEVMLLQQIIKASKRPWKS